MAKLEIVATVQNGRLIPLDLFTDDMQGFEDGEMVQVFIAKPKPEKLRTSLQNASLWKWATNLAASLNYHGFDRRKYYERVLMKGGHPIPWSKDDVIDDLWKPYQKAITGEESTRKPKAAQYQEIYKHVDRAVSEMAYGIRAGWPCRDSQIAEQYNNEL